MYSNKTLKKAMDGLRKATTDAMQKDYNAIALHISNGNKKIGRVHNFSLAPGITCANCSECLRYCYDVKAVIQYKNVLNARADNTALMMKDMDRTFRKIDQYITRRRANKAFRWHVSGDILGIDYFDRMVTIARNHPEWIFWTYTKNYYAVNEWIRTHGGTRDAIPGNLSVMFSIWNGMPCPNQYGLPTFTCIQEGMTPTPGEWRCPGNCDICLKAGRGCPHGESANVDEH